ncbi:hypothetical protein ACFSQQ_07170 [Mesorhizobium kowhaii]|uniref:hypothetical protein n=1 Tax=Mesorhizobium kowhaii TaxID=1300272 RepID=UPI0035E931D9
MQRKRRASCAGVRPRLASSTNSVLARPGSVIVNHQITHDQHGKEPVSDSAGFGVVLAFGLLVLNWLAIRYIGVVAWLASF